MTRSERKGLNGEGTAMEEWSKVTQMSDDNEVIAAGAAAHALATQRGLIQHDSLAAAVINAVEPIIRADERERNLMVTCATHDAIEDDVRAQIATDLRAKVEALPSATIVAGVWNVTPPYDDDWDRPVVFLADVLALLDGEANE